MLTNDRDAEAARRSHSGPSAPPLIPAANQADTPSWSGPVLHAITRASSLLCAAIGVTVAGRVVPAGHGAFCVSAAQTPDDVQYRARPVR